MEEIKLGEITEQEVLPNDGDEAENEIGYEVFICNSEEEAKLMAIAHITSQLNRPPEPVARPTIPFPTYFTGLILPLLLHGAITAGLILFSASLTVWPFIAAYIIAAVFTIKPFFKLFVLLYQKLAPEKLRRACYFEPTCSNYMLLAIDKYGFPRGFCKGVGRLCRCHYPNGGVDNP